MIPLNYSINYAAELSQSPRFAQRQVSARCMSAISLPIELLAAAENAIKLPFQTAACAIKLPVTLLSIVAQSKTLRECADALTSLKDLLQTALKVIGYTAGFFLTATIGMASPYYNFKVHCALYLTTDRAVEKERLLQEEKKRQEIAAYEAVLAAYLHEVILAIQRQSRLAASRNEQANQIPTNETPKSEALVASPPESTSAHNPLPPQSSETSQEPTQVAQGSPEVAKDIETQNLPATPPETKEVPEMAATSHEMAPLPEKQEVPLAAHNPNQIVTMEN